MSEPKRTRLVFLGFTDELLARTVLDVIKTGRSAKEIQLDDWAMVTRVAGGKTTVVTDRSTDPGAARGAAVGGTAGLALAVLSGPIGLGAIVGAAAVGAVTAAVRDSGIKNDDIEKVSVFMAPGRTGLMIAMPLDQAPAWDEFVARHVEFAASDKQYVTDIGPGRTFEQALQEYRVYVDAKI
jgi:uncharacterized membrane protein